MEKVAIIPLTFKSYNYGGTLQYYALQNAVKKIGYEAVVLELDDFSKKIFTNKKKIISLNNPIKKITHKMCWEYSEYKSKKFKETFINRNLKFDNFRKDYIKSYKPAVLESLDNFFSAYIVGSDQIWNPEWACNIHFLTFSNSQTKIVYGASIGKKVLDDNQIDVYGKLLSKMSSISVREADAVNQIQPYVTQHVELVLDPVFLLNSIEWSSLIQAQKKTKSGYFFTYLLGADNRYRNEIKKNKKLWKKKVISIPYITQKYVLNENYADELIIDAGPLDFLELIMNADFIITDSFHAAAFSIIFHKNFLVVNREPNSGQMLSRITTLLKYFNLENRLVKNLNNIHYSDDVDWKEIDFKIKKLSKTSIQFLKRSLEN